MAFHATLRGVLPDRDRLLPVAVRRELDPQTLGRHNDRLYRAARFMCSSREEAVALPETSSLLEDRTTGKPDARLERMALHAAVAALPDIFRDVLIAIDVVGMSYRQAADALGIREATVTTRLHRARQRVARQIDP